MFSSLRARLLLTYALLIGLVLLIAACVLAFSLQNSPILYRSAVLRLRQAEAAIVARVDLIPKTTPDRIEKLIQREADNRKLRIAVLRSDGTMIIDYGAGKSPPLPKLQLPLQPNDADPVRVSSLRDEQRRIWLYTLKYLDTENLYLLITTPRPVFPLISLLRDEILAPFLWTGLVVLVLAVPLGLGMARWISNPLRRITATARRLADGNYQPMPVTGPSEVKQLAQSFNEMANRLKASYYSQREFITNVSHELKTPLTSIQGFAQAILDDAVATPEALKQAAGVIYSEAARMHRLVMDLLILTRLEGGTADLQCSPIDLVQLLETVVAKFSLQAKQANIELQLKPASLPTVVGDSDRLAQVFTNMVDNALKYSSAGGSVVIVPNLIDSWVEVRVMDTGIGISLDDQKRIFERFYQVDKSRRGGSGRGVGLGLAIARQIVLAHSGNITVQSEPGKGSTFTVLLPLPKPGDPTFDIRRDR